MDADAQEVTATQTSTITGGKGCFEGASGSFTVESVSSIAATVNPITVLVTGTLSTPGSACAPGDADGGRLRRRLPVRP